MRVKSHLPLLVLVAVILQVGGCGYVALVKSSETRTQATAHVEGTQLVVLGVNGTIDVIAEADREDVHVTAEITAGGTTKQIADDRLADTVLSVTRDTNRVLTITAEFPKPTTGSDSANLTVRIPAAADVKVNTVNGTINITAVQAPMTLTTTNGRVNVVDSHGDASVTTVNGRIQFERHAGAVTARTTNGRISLLDHDGSADVNTVNGRVTVSLTPDSTGPLRLLTTNGRIEATVGAAFAGQLDATTGNGSITVSDSAGILKSHQSDRRSSKAVFAPEGAKSTLRTSNGSITLTTN